MDKAYTNINADGKIIGRSGDGIGRRGDGLGKVHRSHLAHRDLHHQLHRRRINDLLARCGGLRQAFRKFDVNRDGVVSRDEFALGLASIGFDPASNEIQTLMEIADVDSSGNIQYNEFTRLVNDAQGIKNK